jgi:fructoselysine-6-P-deglycase FrlB-like protein
MNRTTSEILSQPDIWERALLCGDDAARLLRRDGEQMLIVGCGTSAFVAQALARLRERAGVGLTDYGYASEPVSPRDYDVVLAISRSGTTTEVLEMLSRLPADVRRELITAERDTPAQELSDETLVLDFADESSVVQTRFPTTQLILGRQAFGEEVSNLPGLLREALSTSDPASLVAGDHFVFLGTDWAVGLAQEAALKVRETSQAWVEAYPMLDYRHGPIAVAREGSIVWFIGCEDQTLEDDVRRTGANVIRSTGDGLIDLVLAQRAAAELATSKGLDPDSPRSLTRSIILSK